MKHRIAKKVVRGYPQQGRVWRSSTLSKAHQKMKVPLPEIEEPVAEEPVVEESVSPPSSDFADMKVAELRALAKEKGVSGFSKMKKDDLISALS